MASLELESGNRWEYCVVEKLCVYKTVNTNFHWTYFSSQHCLQTLWVEAHGTNVSFASSSLCVNSKLNNRFSFLLHTFQKEAEENSCGFVEGSMTLYNLSYLFHYPMKCTKPKYGNKKLMETHTFGKTSQIYIVMLSCTVFQISWFRSVIGHWFELTLLYSHSSITSFSPAALLGIYTGLIWERDAWMQPKVFLPG